jgi:hypothetical protein
MFDVKRWITKTRVITKGDTTFAEVQRHLFRRLFIAHPVSLCLKAYALTGRALNVATTSTSKVVSCPVASL